MRNAECGTAARSTEPPAGIDAGPSIPHSALFIGILLAAVPASAQHLPPLPDSSGWGVHVLAIDRAPDSSIWVGT